LAQAAYKMPTSLHFLLCLARTMGENTAMPVPMENGVFGNEHNIFINKKDIIQFCLMQPISTICISVYMRLDICTSMLIYCLIRMLFTR
jgi:hypothetical protein